MLKGEAIQITQLWPPPYCDGNLLGNSQKSGPCNEEQQASPEPGLKTPVFVNPVTVKAWGVRLMCSSLKFAANSGCEVPVSRITSVEL